MFAVCKDHLELAIDMFVDEYEEAPDIVLLKQGAILGRHAPEQCMRCDQPPEFVVCHCGEGAGRQTE